MHEILQAYFARKEAEQAQRQAEKKARLEAERREFLIQEGLFEKIYMQPGDDPEEFDSSGVYRRKLPESLMRVRTFCIRKMLKNMGK